MDDQRSGLALLKKIAHDLLPIYQSNRIAMRNAELILSVITNKNLAELISCSSIDLTQKEKEMLDQWLYQLTVKHFPLQYLLGSVPFFDLTILVAPPILIPRPETEYWLSVIMDEMTSVQKEPLQILDLCTGSGCIGLALAIFFPKAHITASDINPEAIALAKKNGLLNQINNITIIESDLFSTIPVQKFDLICANPPYISQNDWQTLDPSVKDWESKQALVAEDDGLAIVKKIIEQAIDWLDPESILGKKQLPQLAIEIAYDQGEKTKQWMSKYFDQVTIIKDLAGHDRAVIGRKLHARSKQSP